MPSLLAAGVWAEKLVANSEMVMVAIRQTPGSAVLPACEYWQLVIFFFKLFSSQGSQASAEIFHQHNVAFALIVLGQQNPATIG